jgi:hypothetical protein
MQRRNTMDKNGKFENVAEMLRSCCPGEGSMADCCSMMRKMMGIGEGEETAKKQKETGEDTFAERE